MVSEKDKQSVDMIEFVKAHIAAAEEGVSGIVLTNTDPRADYIALIDQNYHILNKCGLSVERDIDLLENGSVIITLTLSHVSGQSQQSEIILPKEKYRNPLKEDSPEVFRMSRILYEGLLGIWSINNATTAELYGPKRKHREMEKPYDKTADYIDFEVFDSTGKKYIEKVDRRKFEVMYLGMTSEEEAETIFEVPTYRRFSWSDIKLFLRCKRCFYHKKKLNVRFDDFDNSRFGLEKTTDMLLKREFDYYRAHQKPHPIMKDKGAIKPLKHKKLEEWKNAWTPENRYSIGGVQYHNVWRNWMVYGGVDDIWLNDKKELIIVDYKSSTNGKVYPEYKQQLEFYAWIFKKRNYKVSSTGYLLFYRPKQNRTSFDWRLEFEPSLIDVCIDDSWVQKEISNALECLSADTIPPTGHKTTDKRKKCSLCDYFDNLTEKMKNKSS